MPVKDISLGLCSWISLFNVDSGEKIADINSDSVSITMESEFETDYAKDKNGNKLCSFTRQKSKTVTLEFEPSVNKNKIDCIFGIDKSNVPDEFSLQISIKIQNRKHRKKRINKKWAKRYGYQYKYIDIGKYNIKSNGKDEIVMAKKT